MLSGSLGKGSYFAMVNLIAGQGVVPELVQQKSTLENIVGELGKIMTDGPPRETMIRGLRSVREKLQKPPVEGESATRFPDHLALPPPIAQQRSFLRW